MVVAVPGPWSGEREPQERSPYSQCQGSFFEPPAYGWDNPEWARAGGSKNEPWHWEYGDLS